MSRDVVGTGLHAQFVALGPRVPYKAGRTDAGSHRHRPLAGGGAGSPLIFGRVTVPLIYLDQRLDGGVVVTPVGAHVGRTGVRDGDRVVTSQIRIQLRRSFFPAHLSFRPNQGRHAALCYEDVAMTVWVVKTALVGVDRDKAAA